MLYTEPGTMLGLREEVGTEEGSATPRGQGRPPGGGDGHVGTCRLSRNQHRGKREVKGITKQE